MQHPGFLGYAPLSMEERAMLDRVHLQRWRTNVKRMQITYLTPLVLYWGLLLFLFLTTGWPRSFSDFMASSFFLVPVFFLVTAANACLLVMTMYPIYKDRQQGEKARILFNPEPYTIPESGNLYMKTGIPELPFVEVDWKVFQYLDLIDEMVLEIAPRTRIVLGIKNNAETQTGLVPV